MVTPDELRSLQQPHDEARARRNWEAIQKRRARGGRSPWWLGAGAFAGVLVAAALLLWLLPSPPGPLTAEGREVMGPLPRSVSLDDVSRVEVTPETDLEVLENTGDRLRFWLHAGRASFDVTPNGPRRWVIESGQVTVEVLGTSFVVSRSEHEVTVSVSRGVVLVRGPTTPGGLLRLGAGDSVTVPSDPLSLTAAAVSPPEAIGGVTAPTLAETPSDELAPLAGGSTEDRVAGSAEGSADGPPVEGPAAAGPAADPEEVAAVSSSEGVPEATGVASPTELLDRADVLRREGRFDEAASLLSSITLGPPGPEAALASFTLGRLELERRGHPVEAARAFERAIELGLREPLLEDARARTVEALSRAGDLRATETAAVTYLANYPEGRWCAEVEQWSARP